VEWTDGMEYQLTKIAKTHYCGREVVSIATILPLLVSTGLCLASCFLTLYPDPHAECSACGQGYVWPG